MKVYIAGYKTLSDCVEKVPEATYLLGSYLEFKEIKDYQKWHEEVNLHERIRFLDSGAFSAFSLGKVIDIATYANYIKTNKKFITTYANLDVIGDPIKTQKNQEYLEAQGLSPLPTFHYGSDIKYLKAILKKYDHFALGGLVPLAKQKKKLQEWLDYCWSEIRKQKKLPKVHGFGVSSYWAWERYPWYSTDSTAWISVGKFGSTVSFKNGMVQSTDKSKDRTIAYLLSKKKGYINAMQNAIRTYLRMGEQATKLWEHRGIKWK